MLDSCKFQGFVAKFSRYLPLSGGDALTQPGSAVIADAGAVAISLFGGFFCRLATMPVSPRYKLFI